MNSKIKKSWLGNPSQDYQLNFRCFIFLIFFSGYFNSILFSQNTWNHIGQNNNNKFENLTVKVLNNKIYTFSSSINLDDSLTPYRNINLTQYDYNGELIFDSTLGNSNITFASTPENSFIWNLNNFYFAGYQDNFVELVGHIPTIWTFDSLYNIKFIYNVPPNNYFYTGIGVFNKVNENKYFYSLNIIDSNRRFIKLSTIDSLGNELNSAVINDAHREVFLESFHIHENNFYFVVNKVNTNLPNTPSNLIIFKMDSLLQLVDSFYTTSNNWYFANNSAAFSNGDFIVGGVYSDSWQPIDDLWQRKYIRKFDKNLNIIWTKYFGIRNLNTGITSLKICNNGNIIGTGIDGANSDSIGMHITGCAFMFNSDGDSIWLHNYLAIKDTIYGDNNELNDIDEIPEGGFVVCGRATAFTPYRRRGWIMKIDENGCINSNCERDILGNNEIIKKEPLLLYPNPTNSYININNSTDINSYDIFQLNGLSVLHGSKFPINLIDFSNGTYLLRIKMKTNELINKLIIKQ